MIDWGYRLARPVLMRLDPETAHDWTIRALKFWPSSLPAPADPLLAVEAMGLRFPNPLGLAAGFDKNAEVPDAMLGFGFGFVEVGSVTPLPQSGNPKPRLFRLSEDGAVINRMGFNNQGLSAMRGRLARRQERPGLVGINLGANKDAADRVADYVTGFEALAPFAAYVTVNISSPNTPGLRGLQNPEELARLLGALRSARARVSVRPPLVLKIAPDLDEDALASIVEAAIAHGLDGLIVSNTTLARPDTLRSAHKAETGGLSGAPLFVPSTRVLRAAFQIAKGRIALIGAGGVASGQDAYEKIKAGATLVQLYSALVYEGPGLVGRVLRDLAERLRADGHASVKAAIGSG